MMSKAGEKIAKKFLDIINFSNALKNGQILL